MKFRAWMAVFVLAPTLTLAISGCPPQKMPPFDASGTYEGAWSGEINSSVIGTPLDVTDCPLLIELEQPVNVLLLNFQVVGLLTVNWGCLLPPEVIDLLGLQPTDVTLPILAVMHDDGTLTFNVTIDTTTIDPRLLQLLNIQPGTVNVPLQNLSFELDSQGADTDGDGLMDTLTGNIDLDANFQNNEGTQNVGVTGTFSVDA